jgi:hypothetical protein
MKEKKPNEVLYLRNVMNFKYLCSFCLINWQFIYFLKALCKAGCDKDIPNKYGVTPLYEATHKGK